MSSWGLSWRNGRRRRRFISDLLHLQCSLNLPVFIYIPFSLRGIVSTYSHLHPHLNLHSDCTCVIQHSSSWSSYSSIWHRHTTPVLFYFIYANTNRFLSVPKMYRILSTISTEKESLRKRFSLALSSASFSTMFRLFIFYSSLQSRGTENRKQGTGYRVW